MDLTSEENGLLTAVHALTQIVYPLIKKEFERLCPEKELDKIRMDMYKQQNTQQYTDLHKDGNKSRHNRIHLTQNQQQKVFHQKVSYFC